MSKTDNVNGYEGKKTINWYPGHMAKTKREIAEKLNLIDVVYEVIDEEIELDQGLDKPPYKPRNSEGEGVYFGPTTLRVGLEKSRNVTTIRMSADVGIGNIASTVKRFGINDRPRKIYSLVLGSTETNLLKMVRAYAMIVNGGKKITPTLIEKIQDKNGKIIFKRENVKCEDCLPDRNTPISELVIPELEDIREQITDSATAFQMTNLLEGVVQRGTGWRAKAIKKPIGAKTGTTNDGKDAWFVIEASPATTTADDIMFLYDDTILEIVDLKFSVVGNMIKYEVCVKADINGDGRITAADDHSGNSAVVRCCPL